MSETPEFATSEVLSLPTPRVWRLRILFGGKERVRLLRRGENIVLGTSEDCDVALEDPTVSGRHCELRATLLGLWLGDLGSKNGVYVGSGRVREALLCGRGASFSLGRTTVLVEERVGKEAPADLGLIGVSDSIARVRETVVQFARLRAPVLIRGESGTGKDLVARALHTESGRSGEFCAVNVAAFPEGLLDAELFGHQRGAFTGAVQDRRGLFEVAEGGTLFLDEIAELSMAGQAKLLRVVEDGQVRALGTERTRTVKVRLVSATCAPLTERIRAGAFRHDLFHRLAPLVVDVPPLRERPSDIPLLADHYLRHIGDEVGVKYLPPASLEMLMRAPWLGNVRELFGVIYRSAVLAPGDTITPGHLMLDVPREPEKPRLRAQQALALLDIHGSVSAAARAAGVPRTTFRSVIERDRGRGNVA